MKFRQTLKKTLSLLLATATLATATALPSLASYDDRGSSHNISDPEINTQIAYGLHQDGVFTTDITKHNPLYTVGSANNSHWCKTDADVEDWRVKRDYFAVSYTMTISKEFAQWGHEHNGCCGLILGGDEGNGCVYIPYDVNSYKTSGDSQKIGLGSNGDPRLIFGPWWSDNGIDGGSHYYHDITSYIGQKVTIMLVGSYMNESDYTGGKTLRLKAYLNGQQIPLWGGSYDFVYREPSNNRKFDGKLGYATKLCCTDAIGKFTQSDTPLDSTAFDSFSSSVDASQSANSHYYHYANARQWKVTMRHFALSYTLKMTEKMGDSSDNGCLGLIIGGAADNDDTYGCMVFNYSLDKDGSGSRSSDGYIHFGPWWDNTYLGTNGDHTSASLSEYVGDYKNKNVEIMIVGDVSYNNSNTVTLRAYINGKQVKTIWKGATNEVTATGFNGYVGWMTKLAGAQATARFKQWQDDEFPSDATSLWYKDRGPVNGYWSRIVRGSTDNAIVDVTALPYTYDTETPNMYQLGQIASGGSFKLTATLNKSGRTQGFYFSCTEPDDDIDNSLIGNTISETDKYYLLALEGNYLVLYRNKGDGMALSKLGSVDVSSYFSGNEVRVKLVLDASKSANNLYVYACKPDDTADPANCVINGWTTDVAKDTPTFGLWCKNGTSQMGKGSKIFKAIKVSYGVAAPAANTLAGFVQTRTTSSTGTYDLRVIVEGDDAALHSGTGDKAKIKVKFTNPTTGETKTKTSGATGDAYMEYTFYDDGYAFSCKDGYGMLAIVITKIPLAYTQSEFYLQFCDSNGKDKGDPIKLGNFTYKAEYSENYTSGSPVPDTQ